MFCPECRSEYREGYLRCADCGVDLVEQLPEEEPAARARSGGPPVVVFVSGDIHEAALVRSLLEGSGIRAVLFDEHFSRMDSPMSMIVGGIKVVVPELQAAFAREVLTEYRGHAGQDPSTGRYGPIRSLEPPEQP
jgi:hypothetical protein